MPLARFLLSLSFILAGVHYVHSQCWPEADKLGPQMSLNSRELFAASIDFDSDIAVVGAPQSDSLKVGGGIVYVFNFDGSRWVKIGSLAPADPSQGQGFGRVVRISGDYVYVGDPWHYEGTVRKGLVYVYKKPTGGWQNMTESFRLLTADPNVLGFGASIDLHGNRLIVGAPYTQSSPGVSVGAAYIFNRIGDTWAQEAKFSSTNALGGTFGSNVALKENIAAVVASDEQYPTFFTSGSTYVFHKSTGANWGDALPDARLTLSISNSLYLWLGVGLAIDELRETIFVSASVYDGPASKRVNAFVKPLGGWTDMTETTYYVNQDPDLYAYIAQLQFENPYLYVAASDGVKVFKPDPSNSWATISPMSVLSNSNYALAKRFANSLRVHNGKVLVGATAHYILNREMYTPPATPSVYEFIAPAGGWQSGNTYNEDYEFTYMPKTAANFAFGSAIDIDGDYAVVGAPNDIGEGHRAGAAYVYKLNGLVWERIARLTPSDGENFDRFGLSVAISKNHIAVGAPFKDLRAEGGGAITQFDLGAVYVFEKSAEGWSDMTETLKIINDDIEGSQKDDNAFGISVDMEYPYLVTSRFNSGSRPNFGHVFIYNLSNPVPRLEATLNPSTRSNINNFGLHVKIKKDVIAVSLGASRFYTFDPNYVLLYTKKGTNWSNSFEDAVLYPSDASGSFQGNAFGYGVDMNETATKIIVGAPGWREPGSGVVDHFKGAAYIYEMPEAGWVGSLAERVRLTVPEQPAYGCMGVSVHIEDRYAVVGSPQNYFTTSGSSNPGPGRTYFYQMPDMGWSYKLPDKIIRGDESGGTDTDFFGAAVDGVFGFLMIGATDDDNQLSVDAGSTYIYTEYPFIFPWQDPLCDNQSPVQFQAYPTGGEWSGEGMEEPVTGLFNPALASVGFHRIKYRVDDCDASNSLFIEVREAIKPFILSDSDSLYFCGRDELALNAPSGSDINYAWEYSENGIAYTILDDAHLQTYTARAEGYFRVRLTNYCSENKDEVWVGDLYPEAGEDIHVCSSTTAVQLGGNYLSGNWSGPGIAADGKFTSSSAGLGSHELRFSVSPMPGCLYEDVLVAEVEGIPKLELEQVGADRYCFTGSTRFTATQHSNVSYKWYYGINDQDLELLRSAGNSLEARGLGYYKVVANDGLCEREAVYELKPNFIPEIKPQFDSLSMCGDLPLKVEAEQIADATYEWSQYDGDYSQIIASTRDTFQQSVSESGKYGLLIQSHGCEFRSNIMTIYKVPSDSLFVPNVITPNGDHKNDSFEIYASEGIKNYTLLIINRYGKNVFSYTGNEPKPGWTGEGLTTGVYFWSLSYFDTCIQRARVFNGTVTIAR